MNTIKMQSKIKYHFINTIAKKLILLGCFFLLTGLLSCETDPEEQDVEKKYFDLKGFIENQIVYLSEKKPMVSKVMQLDQKKESIKTDQIDWKKELELFIQSDINKSSYRNSYDVIRSDSSTYEYKLRDSASLPVHYLKIITDSVLHQPVYVKALLKSENRIYRSEKNIELVCSRKDNLLELSSYTIQGYQKLIFMDSRPFMISAKIGL